MLANARSLPCCAGARRASRQADARRPRAAPVRAQAASSPVAGAPNAEVPEGYEVTQQTVHDFVHGYRTLRDEMHYEVDPAWIEGEIPKEITGTLLRNGPALLDYGPGERLNQPFDGDGMAWSFAFRDGRVVVRNKFVRTKGFLEDQAAGKFVAPSVFSTPSGGLALNLEFGPFKNPANTGILHWNGEVLTFNESGLPHALDPITLDTKGETDLGGAIKEGPFHAHYRIVPEADGRRTFVGVGVVQRGLDGEIVLYEFNEDGTRARPGVSHVAKGGGLGFFHDMCVTENYYVLVQNPTTLDLWKLATEYITNRACLAECIVAQDGKPMKLIAIPRPGGAAAGKEAVEIEMDPGFVFHHVNAYELGGSLVLDTLPSPTISFENNMDSVGPEFYEGQQRTEYRRYVFDLEARTLNEAVCGWPLVPRTVEFPIVAPSVVGRPHTHAYAGCSAIADGTRSRFGPNQGWVKITCDPANGVVSDGAGPAVCDRAAVKEDVWLAGPRRFPMEPAFVPRRGAASEDDGWLMGLVHDAETQTADLCILDAKDLAAGPVARVRLPHAVPMQLHGSWTDAHLVGEGDGAAAPAVGGPHVVNRVR
ncbi:unnamed protein product [Pedinophyceae sp. YPF-701]|nr:unnamed protein product [Pedinophyceae sp. YPF-701]